MPKMANPVRRQVISRGRMARFVPFSHATLLTLSDQCQCEGEGHMTSPAQLLSVATANVCTLRPKQLKQVLGRSIGAGVCTRAAELGEVFSSAGLHIVALQECRTQGDGIVRGSHNTMYKTSADAHELDGTQIWVIHSLVKFVTQSVPVSPRMLRVTLCIDGKTLHIISARAHRVC